MPFWYRGPGCKDVPLTEPGLWLPLSCAVAYAASVEAGTTLGATSLTKAFDCAGGTSLLVAAFSGDLFAGSDDCTGVTYAGVSLTLAGKLGVASGRYTYVYYLLSPSAGSNNLVISFTSAHFIGGVMASYSGVGSKDSATTVTANSASAGTTLTTSITPTADNCWTILGEGGYNLTNAAPGAGTGSTFRVATATYGETGLFDSGAAITPAASYSMTTTRAGSSANPIIHVLSAFSPTGGGGGGGNPWYVYAQQRTKTTLNRVLRNPELIWTPDYAFSGRMN